MLDYWNIGLVIYYLPRSRSPLPPHLSFLTLSPYLNGHIRTGLAAECTSSTFPIRLPDDVEISLAIDLSSDFNQSLWTDDCAKPTSFASLLINFDL